MDFIEGFKIFLMLTGALVWICVLAVFIVRWLADDADERAKK